jgi:hypothetical protein
MAFPHHTQRQLGWIWPRDPLPGNPVKGTFRRRLKDILLNKGPDIFVGTIDGPIAKPRTARWSRWQDLYGHLDDDDETTLPSFPWADRGLKRYDFRTRRYRIPNDQTWSWVEYDDANANGEINGNPVFVWDDTGEMYPFHIWQATFGAGHNHEF